MTDLIKRDTNRLDIAPDLSDAIDGIVEHRLAERLDPLVEAHNKLNDQTRAAVEALTEHLAQIEQRHRTEQRRADLNRRDATSRQTIADRAAAKNVT